MSKISLREGSDEETETRKKRPKRMGTVSGTDRLTTSNQGEPQILTGLEQPENLYCASTLAGISASFNPSRKWVKEGITQGYPIRFLIPDIHTWLVDGPKWGKKREILINDTIEKLQQRTTKRQCKFGVDSDTNKTSTRRLRIPLRWTDLDNLGFGQHHIVQNAIAKVLCRATSNGAPERTRPYSYQDYRLFAAAVFVDPPGTSPQHFHEDLHGMDRVAVWNLMIPIKLPEDQRAADTTFAVADSFFKTLPHSAQSINDAVAWDANWLHRGLGNPSVYSKPSDGYRGYRFQLHMVFAPKFFLFPIYYSLSDKSLCVQVQESRTKTQDLTGIVVMGVDVRGIIHAQCEIAREYNHGVNVFYEFGEEVDRMLHETHVQNKRDRGYKKLAAVSHRHHASKLQYNQTVKPQQLATLRDTKTAHNTEVGYFVSQLIRSTNK